MKNFRKVALGAAFVAAVGFGVAAWHANNQQGSVLSPSSRRSGTGPTNSVTTSAPPPPRGATSTNALRVQGSSGGSNTSNSAKAIPVANYNITSNGTNLSGMLVDGTYTGRRSYAYYGYVQLRVRVKGGKISNVQAIEYPTHAGTSRYINGIAIPYLDKEAVQMQTARIYLISGATLTSNAFAQSLNSVLQQALNPQAVKG